MLLCHRWFRSSAYAMRHSLENGAQHLDERLEQVQGRERMAQSPTAVNASSPFDQRTA